MFSLVLGLYFAGVHGLDTEGQKMSQLATDHRHFLEGTVYIKDKNTIEIR